MIPPLCRVVLVEPEIPQNTGSIGRLCLGLQSELHLVEPLGFDLSESKLKRAGLDYWEHLSVFKHKSLEDLLDKIPESDQKVFFTKKATQTTMEFSYEKSPWLFFGKETQGLPEWLIDRNPLTSVRIPILDARVRSFNLAQSVAIGLYSVVIQNSLRS